eukprot:1494715-Rhodomonas_salina.2
MPLISGGFRCSLHSASPNRRDVTLIIESGCDTTTTSHVDAALWVSVGPDPFELLEAGFGAVAARKRSFRTRSQKPLPDAVDLFGFCTWNAFYSKVTASSIFTALRSLRSAGAHPRWLIIDDGWQAPALSPPRCLVHALWPALESVSCKIRFRCLGPCKPSMCHSAPP